METYRTEITLDLNGQPEDQLVTAKQGDQFTRIIQANIVKDGTPIQIGETAATFTCHKPDGTQVVQSANILKSGAVSLALSKQCFAVAGPCRCEFTFKQDEYILSTAVFTMMVYPSAYDPGALESTDDYQGFLEAIEEANNAAGAANTAAESANTAAGEATSAANDASREAERAYQSAQAANAAAGKANSAASAANNAASSANSAADYAEEQGDYAKAQGDYAKGVAREARCLIPIPYGDNIPTEDRTAGVFYLQQTEEEGIPGAAFPAETDGTVTRPAAAPLQSAKILGETTETGTGDKSPQNPYTISGAEPTKLRVCGKNLIPTPANGQSSGGVAFTVNEDGSITVQGTAPTSGHVYFNLPKFFLKQGQYCLSAGTNMPTGTELVLRKGTAIEVICQVSAGQSSVTKNIPYTGEVMPYIVVFQGNTVDTTIYPQLELGSTASAYESYQGTDTELPDLSPLYSLPGNISDSYDAVSGKEVRRTKCVKFDGGEDWIKSTQTENRFLLEDGDWKANQNPICSHYPSGANTGVWIDSYNGGRLIIDVPAEQGITDLASWGYFLSDQYQEGTPVTVVYELSEPEKTVHMPEEIPVTEDTRLIAADAGGMQAVYLQVPEGKAFHTQLQDANGNVLCPSTDADSVFGLAKVAKTGKYSDLTGAPAEIPFETGSFSMSPMPGTCYYQRVGNFCFLSCPSTSFNGSGNGAADGLPFRAVTAKCNLCPSSYNADFNGEIKVSGSTLYYNTHSSVAFSGSFTCLYQIEEE